MNRALAAASKAVDIGRGMQDASNQQGTIWHGSVFGIAALWLTCSGWAHAWGGCKSSDWPLDIAEGSDEWILTVRPAAKPRIVVQEVTRRAHSTAATVAPSPDTSAAPRARRDWNAGRRPAANDRERLIYAVHDDDLAQISRYLRQPGMNLNAPISATSRLSLLDFAIQLGYPEATRLLIEAGAHVRAEPGDAVDVHPIKTAVDSLSGEVHARDFPDPFINRPLHSIESHLATVRILLDADADPNEGLASAASPSPLATLLYTPRFDGDVELARLLVTHGAATDAEGSWPAPLVIAIERGYVDYVDALSSGRVSSATLNAALIAASRHEEVEIAERLLQGGADANTVDNQTPLLCAAFRSRERRPMALALLAHGANVNAACGTPVNGPYTPLTLVDKSDHELIDRLLQGGGQLAIPAQDQREYESHGVQAGPIIWSLMHDGDYLASKLIARDPRLAEGECGAVVYAGRFGADLTLVELFKRGADPNSTSERGLSALMAAAFYNQSSAMRVLLAQPRIDIGQKTPRHANPAYFTYNNLEGERPPLIIGGRTALAYAKLGGSRDALELLTARGDR